MSALADWLDQHLAPDDAPEGTDEQWRVTDEASADWAARKIQRYARERDAKQAEYDRIVDAATAWLQTETAELDRQIGFFEGRIGEWLAGLIEADPDGKKSRRLPCGATVRRVGGRASVEVVDEDVFRTFAESAGRNDLLRIRVDPDKRALAKLPVAGEVIVTEDGEPIPGVRVTVSPDRFSVDPGGGA